MLEMVIYDYGGGLAVRFCVEGDGIMGLVMGKEACYWGCRGFTMKSRGAEGKACRVGVCHGVLFRIDEGDYDL